MAKFITRFDTVNAYIEAAPSFNLPHMALTKDNNVLHYHPISSLAVGTYLYNDGTTGTTANSNVVGICVIPDGLLPDKRARFMSVKSISRKSTAGTTLEIDFNWSNFTVNTCRSLLPKQYTEVPCVGLNEDEGTVVITNQVEHSNNDGYMSSDSSDFTAIANPYDSVTMFSRNDYDNYTDHHIPSPFMNNGAFNENYSTLFTTGGTAINNALSDFDGFRNTQILIKDADIVAAKHCAIFNPGYGKGKWYLPAVGELAFIVPRLKVINSKLSALGSSGVQLSGNSCYWSSTEYDDEYTWFVDTCYGHVDRYWKFRESYVRPFLAL